MHLFVFNTRDNLILYTFAIRTVACFFKGGNVPGCFHREAKAMVEGSMSWYRGDFCWILGVTVVRFFLFIYYLFKFIVFMQP